MPRGKQNRHVHGRNGKQAAHGRAKVAGAFDP